MTDESTQKYRIVFKGEIEAGQETQTVKEHLAGIFKIPPERIDRLFTGKPIILKNNLDYTSAQEYIALLKNNGAICYSEPITEHSPVQTDNEIHKVTPFSQGSILYRVGLVLAATGMVLLPTVYVFFILFIANTTYSYSEDNIFLLDVHPFILGLLVYCIPILSGIVLVAFMIKPFFVPSATKRFSISLSRKKEQMLFTFVEKLCRSIGSPVPSSIEVNCSVKASTSFRRGIVSFLEDDFTLMFGLPLVSEMTLAEFTCVLTHEFGHFTNKVNMRFYFILSSIRTWFAHVVFERDLFDQKLIEWLATASIILQIPLRLAQFFEWLVRKILLAFKYAGDLASSYFLCRMEFDADNCAIQITGSDVFESSIHTLNLLTAASRQAFAQLKIQRKPGDNSLPDNFVSVISSLKQRATEEEISKIKKNSLSAKRKKFDQYPTDRERINNAKGIHGTGTFQSDKSALTLFSNFDEITKISTVHLYQDVIGLRITEGILVPVSDYLNPSDETAKASETDLNVF